MSVTQLSLSSSCPSTVCIGIRHLRTILVTGGGGYVGSHTIIELLNNNYTVIVVDNLKNCYAQQDCKPESLKRIEKLLGKSVLFYKVDVENAEDLDVIFRKHKVDCVIHCAALKAVGESVEKPLEYYKNNVAGSITLLEVMQNNGVKKLLYSSSATVYGIPKYLPIAENHPTGQKCTNPYGKTKYFTEEILKDLCTSDSQWKLLSLRYFNPVGAHESGLIGEDPLETPNNLMPIVAQVAVGRREKVNVFGSDYSTPDGTGVRDYIHIMDLAVGHVRALEKLFEPTFVGFKAYNLGTGHGYSVLDVIKAFSKACGKEINYSVVGRREGDVDENFANAELAEKELKWKAVKNLEDMCRDTWNWQQKNPNGFKS